MITLTDRTRARFDEDMQYLFTRVLECREHHASPITGEQRHTFCNLCLDNLHSMIQVRDSVNDRLTFLLDEHDMCALLRQTYRQYIPTEGISGPRFHDLYRRLVAHIGREKYAEFVAKSWPKRLT